MGEKRGRTELLEEGTLQSLGKAAAGEEGTASPLGRAATVMDSSVPGEEVSGGRRVNESERFFGQGATLARIHAQATQQFKKRVGENRGRTELAEAQLPSARSQDHVLGPEATADGHQARQKVTGASNQASQGSWPKRVRREKMTNQCDQRRGSELCPSQCACRNHLPAMSTLKVKLAAALGQEDQQGLLVTREIEA